MPVQVATQAHSMAWTATGGQLPPQRHLAPALQPHTTLSAQLSLSWPVWLDAHMNFCCWWSDGTGSALGYVAVNAAQRHMRDVMSEFMACCRDTVTASNPNVTTGGSSVGARKLPAATPPDVNATWLDVDDPPGATCEVSWRRVHGHQSSMLQWCLSLFM